MHRREIFSNGYLIKAEHKNLWEVTSMTQGLGQIQILLLILAFANSTLANELWPVGQAGETPKIGANFSHPQKMGSLYFHSGIDFRVDHGEEVRAIESGNVSAGFYKYSDRPDGHYYFQKKYEPLDPEVDYNRAPTMDDYRFEVSVTTDDGLVHEYHHIDPTTLSDAIRKKIFSGSRVEAGDVIGNVLGISVVDSNETFDHLHFNVVDENGAHLNPRNYLPKIEDRIKPHVGSTFYGPFGRCSTGIGENFKLAKTDEFPAGAKLVLITAHDRIEKEGFFLGMTKVEITYLATGETRIYDFTDTLLDEDEKPYNLKDLVHENFCLMAGIKPIPQQGTTNKRTLYRVEIPDGYTGKIEVVFSDYSGNKTSKTLEIR